MNETVEKEIAKVRKDIIKDIFKFLQKNEKNLEGKPPSSLVGFLMSTIISELILIMFKSDVNNEELNKFRDSYIDMINKQAKEMVYDYLNKIEEINNESNIKH